MAKRDIVQEIKEKNLRTEIGYLHGNLELYALESMFRKLDDNDKPTLSLIVMGVASCVEVGVREAIKRLVDSGEPFLGNAEKFKDYIKFDFLLTKELSSGSITFGDLISHSLPVSNLHHIAGHFENLFFEGSKVKFIDILSNLRVFVEPDDEELFNENHADRSYPPPFMLENATELLKDISSIFETRHLVAHEANFKVISFIELEKLLKSARSFLNSLYELVEQRLNPGASRNGFGLSIQELYRVEKIHREAIEVQDKIFKKLHLVREEGDELKKLFTNSLEAFDSLHQAEVEFRLKLHGLLSSNAMRNIESEVTEALWLFRSDYLSSLDDHVNFYANLE